MGQFDHYRHRQVPEIRASQVRGLENSGDLGGEGSVGQNPGDPRKESLVEVGRPSCE